MKIRDFKRHTFSICQAFLKCHSIKNLDRMVRNLRRWSRFAGHGKMDDYGYSMENHESLLWTISYCSDRMNQGRAKAILRLLDEEATIRLIAMFDRYPLPDPPKTHGG